jgi:vacuolar protein 8
MSHCCWKTNEKQSQIFYNFSRVCAGNIVQSASFVDAPLHKDRTTTNFFAGDPLTALTTLSFSDNVDLQRSAALAFAEITEKEVRPVGRDTLDPILFLLSSHDTEVQRAASAALGNLAVNSKLKMNSLYASEFHLILPADNKLLIVKLGGLEPLIRQMLSPNVEVQCNAVGCVTNLATHGRSASTSR